MSKMFMAIMTSKFRFLGLVLGCLILGSSVAHATLSLSNITLATSTRSKAPQGSSKVNMMFVQVKATGAETVSKITLRCTSSQIKFGQGIKNVYILQDTVGDQIFDAARDTQLASTAFAVLQTGDVALTFNPVSILDGKSVGFFIAYDLETTVGIGNTANVEIVSVANDTETASVDVGTPLSNSLSITGISATANVLAPAVLIPGDLKTPIFRLELLASGENMDKNDLTFIIKNDSKNYANIDGATSGITAAYLYLDGDGNGLFDVTKDTLLQSLSGTAFMSSSEAKFSPSNPPLKLVNNVQTGLFVLFDLGKNTTVTTDLTVQAQLSSLSGTGTDSGLPLSILNASPILPATSTIAGMTYANLTSIVPTGNSFGAGTVVPILRSDITCVGVSVTLNSVTLQTNGTVKFVTDTSQTNGITRASIYEDANRNAVYDGAVGGDMLVGTLVLGNGAGQTAETAVIPLTAVDGKGLLITTNNVKTLFAVYELGQGVTDQRDVSGNTVAFTNATLLDISGSSNVTSATIRLSGVLPASSVPTAQVAIKTVNMSVVEALPMAPATCLQGQVQVPMLFFSLRSNVDLSSGILKLYNNRGSFFDNGGGVSKISVFSDDDADGVLEQTDSLVGATMSFRSPLEAVITPFPISTGTHGYFITYDIGQNALEQYAACQLVGISSSSNTQATPLLGGDLPVPKQAPFSNVLSGRLSISSVVTDVGFVTNLSPSFSAHVGLTNSSVVPVVVQALTPRIYLADLSGPDISDQFDWASDQTFPFIVPASSSVTVDFGVKPSRVLAEATNPVDAFCRYVVVTTNMAVLSRYRGPMSIWKSAASNPTSLTVKTNRSTYAWQVPDYIDSMSAQLGNQSVSFQNGDAVAADASLMVLFKNKGDFIDPGSFRFNLIPSASSSASSLSSYSLVVTGNISYTYDRTQGLLTFQSLAKNARGIEFSVQDTGGATLPTASIRFVVKSSMSVDSFLCYPSPYSIGGGALTMGFNLSQPGTVQIKVFNMLGLLVWSGEQSYATLGYKELLWDGVTNAGGFLGSGVYLLRLVATGDFGNTFKTYTKLAVY